MTMTRFTQQQEDAIRQELQHILHHSCFRSSERCSKLLRFIVESSLGEHPEQIKERAIGHGVFGRPITYETSSDPIVRNAALELRRRLAQYSAERTGHHDVLIQLLPGSYVPNIQFTAADEHTNNAESQEAAHVADTPSATPAAITSKRGFRIPRIPWARALWSSTAAVVAGVLIFQAGVLHVRAKTVVDPFWQPFVLSPREALICVSGEKPPKPAETLRQTTSSLPFVDAKAYANISNALSRYGKEHDIRLADETNFDQLRERPVVLVGGFRNRWTLKLSADEKYLLRRDEKSVWIEDESNPAHPHVWETAWTPDMREQSVAYAVISRIHNPSTGSDVVTVTGLGTHGTEAASEFLAKPASLQGLPAKLIDPKTNVQIILKTTVIDGTTGDTSVVATYLW